VVPSAKVAADGDADVDQTPGQLGPSVILGHIDSAKNGPSVFFKLGALRPGQQIQVARADRSTARFRAWVLVTPVPSSRDAKASVVPRSFGRCNVTGPEVVLMPAGAFGAPTAAVDPTPHLVRMTPDPMPAGPAAHVQREPVTGGVGGPTRTDREE